MGRGTDISREMKEDYELGNVELFSPCTLGEPGKRTFFLILGDREEWLRVWLEKEQLQALGLAVEQFFMTLRRENIPIPREAEADVAPEPGELPRGLPSVELEIDQMALGYDRDEVVLNFSVHKSGETEEDEPSTLNCKVSLAQLQALGTQAREICAAGRPRCILCGLPIDPEEGHICPRSN